MYFNYKLILIFLRYFFVDIEFQLEDGVIVFYKLILMVRCEMMFVMFSVNFMEFFVEIVCFQIC